MPDAILLRGLDGIRKTNAAAVATGEVHQLADGRAGVYTGLNASGLGDVSNWTTEGQFTVTKTSGVVILDGGRVYWDHSANAATYKKVNDRDFYIGRAVGDAASAATTLVVNLNVDAPYDIDLARDPYITVPVGTQALGGFLPPAREGGAIAFKLTATNEAQKADAISVDGFSKDANAIVEFAFRMPNGGSGTASDFSIGIANATHATDADSITDSVFCHMDGGSTNIAFESDDGTTEVAATDSTLDFTAGTAVANRVEVWFDLRNPADIQVYVNGANVLPASVFNIDASTAVWKLFAHVEKTSGTETADMTIDWLRVRYAEQ
jgi:predicted RecA/RadA family phage recombinase